MGSYDRVDFYRKNRDYGGLLDDEVVAEEEEEAEEVYEDDDEGSEQCRSEPEEDPEVVREQQEYLKRREKMKELERQKMKQKLQRLNGRNYDTDSEIDKKKLPYDNSYGSFFGPSQPVVARRVIEEAKARMEATKIVAKASKEVSDKSYSTTSDMRYEEKEQPKVMTQTKTKAQQLKAARDYSFLFNEDAEIPGTDKGSDSKSSNFSRPDNVQSKPFITKSSTPLKKPAYSGNLISSTKDSKRMSKSSRQMPVNVGTHKTPQQKVLPISKPFTSDPRNLINKVASGSARPITQGNGSVRPSMSNGTKVGGVDINKKKASLISTSKYGKDELQRSTNGCARAMQKSVSSKPPVQNVHPDQRKPSALVKPAPKLVNKVAAKPTAKPGMRCASNLPSKPQLKPPIPRKSVDDRPKKRPKYDDSDDDLDSGGNYRSLIRQMFRYNPNKYGNVDDEDDRAMEVGFNTIQAEERRSAKFAKEEDERELALIEAEEREERLRAKKRKLQ